MKKTKQIIECKWTVKKIDCNVNRRKEYKKNELIKKEFIECICVSKKEIIDDVLENTSLKDVHSPFFNRLQKVISIPFDLW